MTNVTKDELIEAMAHLSKKLQNGDITIDENSVKYEIKSNARSFPAYNCTLIDLPGNRTIDLKILHKKGF